MKYAIRVNLSNSEWLIVQEGTADDMRPLLFDTYEQAESHAQLWRLEGKEHNVQVIDYEPNKEHQ
jgi:hypothetical protein